MVCDDGPVSPARRKIDPMQGRTALAAWVSGERERATVATAVRYSLEELGLVAPGRSVEVRVPPYGAVQVIAGQVHRRGTPPNVVEMPADIWLALVVGDLAWDDALSSGSVSASGGRSDLTPYLPLMSRK